MFAAPSCPFRRGFSFSLLSKGWLLVLVLPLLLHVRKFGPGVCIQSPSVEFVPPTIYSVSPRDGTMIVRADSRRSTLAG